MKGDSASENNESYSVSEIDKSDSPKKDDWTQELGLSKSNDASVREKTGSMLCRYSGMWSRVLRGLSSTERILVLKPDTRSVHQMPYRQGLHMRAIW